MVYDIFYGEIKKDWDKSWGNRVKNNENNPYDVLVNNYRIDSVVGGWTGFHGWANDNCIEPVEIDWGSRGWKCKGSELIRYSKYCEMENVDNILPDKEYGVIFIEVS